MVAQGLAGGHHHAVAGVNAHRVQVFHVAHGDHIALVVTHHLVLDLFPAGDALFHQDLVNGRKAQAVGGDLVQLLRGFANAAAGAAHGKGGAHDHGIADLSGKLHGAVQIFHHLAGNDGLVQLFHGVFKQLAVLGTVDGVRLAGQQAHTAFIQKAVAGQLHADVQAHLAAQIGQNGIRLFLFDDALHHAHLHGLDIHMVGHVGVCHNGGGVRVQQHGLNAFGFERAAGLGAGVVELRSLTDDNRAGTDHQHLFNTGVLRHRESLLSQPRYG